MVVTQQFAHLNYNHSLPLLLCYLQLKYQMSSSHRALENDIQSSVSTLKGALRWTCKMFIRGWRSISDHYVIDGIRGNMCCLTETMRIKLYLLGVEGEVLNWTLKKSITCRSPFLKQCIEIQKSVKATAYSIKYMHKYIVAVVST